MSGVGLYRLYRMDRILQDFLKNEVNPVKSCKIL
jgi:hypothetical protein